MRSAGLDEWPHGSGGRGMVGMVTGESFRGDGAISVAEDAVLVCRHECPGDPTDAEAPQPPRCLHSGWETEREQFACCDAQQYGDAVKISLEGLIHVRLTDLIKVLELL